MSSYDDYQKNAAKIGKEPGRLSIDDIAFMASQSKDFGKAYAEYEMFNESEKSHGGGSSTEEGCYIATCVYGSYDCPEVWTLRRFRDRVLRQSACGRLFVRCYYAVSPALVKLLGNSRWFHRLGKHILTPLVMKLKQNGLSDAPYTDGVVAERNR